MNYIKTVKVVIELPEAYYDFCKWCKENGVSTAEQDIIVSGKLCDGSENSLE